MLRRAGRQLFTVLSALSLLLCVATCVLWVRSYFRYDRVTHFGIPIPQIPQWIESLTSGSGTIVLTHASCTANDPKVSASNPSGWFILVRPDVAQQMTGWNTITKQFGGERAGFGWAHSPDLAVKGPLSTTIDTRWVVFPHWFLVLMSAALPSRWLLTTLRRRRAERQGLCPECGYDLRASPERCPECGLRRAQSSGTVKMTR